MLSFGTAGCNLACSFRQNWDISQEPATSTRPERAGRRRKRSPRAASALGCGSVAYTYNDPVIFAEYALDAADGLSCAGREDRGGDRGLCLRRAPQPPLRSKWMRPTSISKAFTERVLSSSCTGHARAGPRYAEIPRPRNRSLVRDPPPCSFLARTISIAEIEALSTGSRASLGPDVPLHFTAFHPDYQHAAQTQPTLPATLQKARADRHLAMGFITSMSATSMIRRAQATLCPTCGARAISRDGYTITTYALDASGACTSCGTRDGGRVRGEARRLGLAAAVGRLSNAMRREVAPNRRARATGRARPSISSKAADGHAKHAGKGLGQLENQGIGRSPTAKPRPSPGRRRSSG